MRVYARYVFTDKLTTVQACSWQSLSSRIPSTLRDSFRSRRAFLELKCILARKIAFHRFDFLGSIHTIGSLLVRSCLHDDPWEEYFACSRIETESIERRANAFLDLPSGNPWFFQRCYDWPYSRFCLIKTHFFFILCYLISSLFKFLIDF